MASTWEGPKKSVTFGEGVDDHLAIVGRVAAHDTQSPEVGSGLGHHGAEQQKFAAVLLYKVEGKVVWGYFLRFITPFHDREFPKILLFVKFFHSLMIFAVDIQLDVEQILGIAHMAP